MAEVSYFQSRLWRTNTVLITSGADTFLFDPTFATPELAAIQSAISAIGPTTLHVLITHSHFDHTCGISSFPDAEVIVGRSTATAIDGGTTAEQITAAGASWGAAWPGPPRYDRVVEAGTSFECGGLQLDTVDITGNSADGIAYVVPALGLLVSGDYFSVVCIPSADESLDDVLGTYHRLSGILGDPRMKTVVPGHGPRLDPNEAQSAGEADAKYLTRLNDAASSMHESSASRGDALTALYEIEPPRVGLPEFEIYGPRLANISLAWSAATGDTATRPSQTFL